MNAFRIVLLFIGSLLLCVCAIAQSITVDGYAYLEGASTHEDVMVIYERTVPYALYETAYTNGSGYYTADIETGIYNIYFSKDGYLPDSMISLTLYENEILPDVTLEYLDMDFLHGALSGVLSADEYDVGGDIWVEEGNTLEIEPGTILRFRQNIAFHIYGSILAIGTEYDSIIFTHTEDTVAWGGIRFHYHHESAGMAFLSHCIVEYSNTNGIRSDSLRWPSEIIIAESNIRNNDGYGIWLYGNSIDSTYNSKVVNSIISNNGNGGIFVCANPLIENSVIKNNAGNGITGSKGLVANTVIVNNEIAGVSCTLFLILLNCIVVGSGSCGISGEASINYCDVYGNTGGNFSETPDWVGVNVTTNANGDSCDPYGNIQLDPMLTDTASGDYHLLTGSPCINVGGMFTITSWFDTVYAPDSDWDGESRPMGAGFDIGYDEFTEFLLFFGGYIVDRSILGEHSEHTDPMLSLGEPDSEFVSLGVDGWIEIAILNSVSDSIVVYEAPDEAKSITEEGFSLYGKKALSDDWTYIADGMGTTTFELPIELEGMRFVRIEDDGDGDPLSAAPGFDLDAVGTIALSDISENDRPLKPEMPVISVFPNPFNSSCKITVGDACMRPATIEILDLNGRIVAAFDKTPVIWQPEDEIGSGIYLVRARAGKNTLTKRIVYMK